MDRQETPHIGKAVKHRRNKLGWTGAELIRQCGCISKGYLSQWENGKVPDEQVKFYIIDRIEYALMLEPGTFARYKRGKISLDDLSRYSIFTGDLDKPERDILSALRGESLVVKQVAANEILDFVGNRGEVRILV